MRPGSLRAPAPRLAGTDPSRRVRPPRRRRCPAARRRHVPRGRARGGPAASLPGAGPLRRARPRARDGVQAIARDRMLATTLAGAVVPLLAVSATIVAQGLGILAGAAAAVMWAVILGHLAGGAAQGAKNVLLRALINERVAPAPARPLVRGRQRGPERGRAGRAARGPARSRASGFSRAGSRAPTGWRARRRSGRVGTPHRRSPRRGRPIEEVT